MKNANFYLAFLSLAVIGLSTYTIKEMLEPTSTAVSIPQVLGESTDQKNCKVGLTGFIVGIKCSNPSMKLINSTSGAEADFYQAASYECADGTKGTVQKNSTGSTPNNPDSLCLPENSLRAMAEKECKARSSCGQSNYTPCAEVKKIEELLACPANPDQSSKTGINAACYKISNLIHRFCPAFSIEPKPTSNPKPSSVLKPTNTPKLQSCKSGTKTITAIKDKSCQDGQYRKIRYTCQGGSSSSLKLIGDNTSPCRTLTDLKNEASLVCGLQGTCPDGQVCGPDKKCTFNP